MQIHNYYSDLCLSVRTLFDNYIFKPTTIRSYDFNIANRTFSIDKEFKTQYELPACIVTLNDDHYIFGERPNVIQHFGPENQMQHKALINFETNAAITVQEEHVQTNISVMINCETQLQAKELEFTIKRYLPLSKYIQILEFTSFLEVSYEHLRTLDYENYGHKIANLFTKLNENKGQVEYCYSMRYRPHIRLESISSNIADSSQRAFSVNAEISYLTQMPMFTCIDNIPQSIEAINVIYSRLGNDPISDYPVQKVLNIFKEINLEEKLGSPIPKPVTENGKWIIDPDTQVLSWVDRYTGNIFEVASKPNDGYWGLDGNQVIWIRDSDGEKFYLDSEKESIRRGSIYGPVFLKIGDVNKLFSKPKTFIRRTYLIYDETDVGAMYTDKKVTFCVKFDKNDFVIHKQYRYNFVDRYGEIIRDYPYLSCDQEENKVCFSVEVSDWKFRWKPSLTSPLMIQFIEPSPTGLKCSDLVTGG
jgi:hypothetical protein